MRIGGLPSNFTNCKHDIVSLHRFSKKCAKLFLSELHQISTNFDNFSQKGGKETKIMGGGLIFHLI